MNKQRIKELMTAASKIRYSGFGDTEILDPEKFAELIIQECKQAMETAWYATGQDVNGRSIEEFSAEFNKQIGVK